MPLIALYAQMMYHNTAKEITSHATAAPPDLLAQQTNVNMFNNG